jgi:acyl-CoA dehydrogenase
MAWDFETDSAYQAKLDWADAFVREEVEPLDLVWPHEQFVPLDGGRRKAIDPLKQQVRAQDLWATHLSPELGGKGHGQVKLALLNEILGRSSWAPIVFGCQAPDTGNAEIIAHYGTPEQKQRYLRTIGLACKALDMMCERALSRETAGSRLSEKQFVQGYIADSYAQLQQFELAETSEYRG